MVVPATVQEISKGNYECCNPPINLQGYVLGNPLTDFVYDYNSRIPFAHGMALISDELFESLKKTCKGDYRNVHPRNTECLKFIEEFNKCTNSICQRRIIDPFCETETPNCYVSNSYNLFLPSVKPFEKNICIQGCFCRFTVFC
jgi:serine carboxypeptidase-like clade 1